MPDHPRRAAETTLNRVSRLKTLKRESPIKGVRDLAVGIGLNTGQVTVGNLGSQRCEELLRGPECEDGDCTTAFSTKWPYSY